MSDKSGWFDPSERDDRILSSSLPPGEKLLLLAISFHMWKENLAFPAIATLADRTSQGVRTVKRLVATLTKRGVLQVFPGHTNRYRIAWDTLAALYARDSATVAPRGHRAPSDDLRQVVCDSATVAPYSATVAPYSATVAPPIVPRWHPEGEREGATKGEKEGASAPQPQSQAAQGGKETCPGSWRPQAVIEACTVPQQPDTGRRSLLDLAAEVATLDAEAWAAHLPQEGVSRRTGDPEEAQAGPEAAEDPEAEEARLWWERKVAADREALRREKAEAATLDRSLPLVRNPTTPSHKRVQHAINWFGGVRLLCGLETGNIRFHPDADENLAKLELLPPDVSTWDLVSAIRDARLESPCWRVLLCDGVWPGIIAAAESYAGRRLISELKIVSYMGDSPIEAVRQFRAGQIDREGARLSAVS